MKRTARLVRLALEGRPAAQDPWIRGAADVAAAVARSGPSSRHEGATAAGGRGGGPSRDRPLDSGGLGGGYGRQLAPAAGGSPRAISPLDVALAAGGPGAISSRVVAQANGGLGVASSRDRVHAARAPPAAISPLDIAHAAGGPRAISSRDRIVHDAGGPSGGGMSSRGLSHAAARGPGGLIYSRDHAHAAAGGQRGDVSSGDRAHAAAGGPPGVVSSRDRAHAAGGLGAGSGDELARAVLGAGRGSASEDSLSVAKKGKGAIQVDAEYQGRQEGRVGKDCLQQSSSSASSSKVCPISVHDKAFLSCHEFKEFCDFAGLTGDEDWATRIDVSDRITSLLIESAGPVLSFCIDSSRWTHSANLENWLDLLSQKSVQEVHVLNLGHQVTSRFPIESLQSNNLEILRIGFFAVSLDLLCFKYNLLHTLDFFACTLESNKLSWIVSDCPLLKELKVHHCYVDLHIQSKSLQVLDSFGNIGNRIVIVSAPNLQSLVCGIIPTQKSAILRQRISASIYLDGAPMLKFIKQLSMPYHKITLHNKDLTKDTGNLPYLERLNLSMEMGNPTQLQGFRKMLEWFPVLQVLCVERLDSVALDEGFDIRLDQPFEDIGMVDCVKNCLRTFSLHQFQGGPADTHLIMCLLKNAPYLNLLSTRRSKYALKKAIRDAWMEIKACEMASEVCQFSLK